MSYDCHLNLVMKLWIGFAWGVFYGLIEYALAVF